MKELINKLLENYKNEHYKKSPFSRSYYFFEDFKKNNRITWGQKPDDSLRIADHWNFWCQGENHCIIKNTDETIEIKGWKICKYDGDSKTYSILCEDEELILNLLDKFQEIYNEKQEIIRIEQEKLEVIKEIERKKIEKENKKMLKIATEKFIDKINKNEKMKNELQSLINLGQFHINLHASRGYKQTPELKLYTKFELLFQNTIKSNDAPRGGKIGDMYILNKKDINKIKKGVEF